jgi:UDP-N-acetylglucosamine acyltransferase
MIHKLAVVHPDAQIGKNVTIEPFSVVDKNTVIGDGCWIGPNVNIMSGARMGKNCKIFPGAVVSAIPQDLKFAGEDSTVEMGDNVTIRECVTVNRGTKTRNKTIIGNNTLLMAYVHIAHDCVIGNNCVIVNYTGFAGEVEVGDFAIVSGATVVHQFVRIGMHCIIGGGSKVRVDVPPFVKADREPLSYVGINSVGLRRRQFSSDIISSIQEMYRLIYQQNLNISQALDRIEREIPQSVERDEILNFFRKSTRGFIKRPT